MPEYADIYALSVERTPELIVKFLDHFLPSRIESADEYELPQYSDNPHSIFKTADELITFCCHNPTEVHSIYWRSESALRHAEVFFLADGGLILGLSVPAEDNESVDRISHGLSHFLNSSEIFITYEDTPPDSMIAFRSILSNLVTDPPKAHRRNRIHKPIKMANKAQ